MKKIIAVLTIVILIFTGCSNNQNENLEEKNLAVQNQDTLNENKESSNDRGYFDGNQYYNEYFAFSFNFPEEWEIQGKEQILNMTNNGREAVKGKDESSKEQVETLEDEITRFNLMACKYPLETSDMLNPMIVFIGQDISSNARINNAEDFINNIKDVASNAQIEIKIVEEKNTTIKGHEFKVLHTVTTIEGVELNQVMHVRLDKGVIIGIAVTYFDEETKNEVFDVLRNGYNSMS
jgi:uncharacterized protein YxeA